MILGMYMYIHASCRLCRNVMWAFDFRPNKQVLPQVIMKVKGTRTVIQEQVTYLQVFVV